jgi:hypothetical protein
LIQAVLLILTPDAKHRKILEETSPFRVRPVSMGNRIADILTHFWIAGVFVAH